MYTALADVGQRLLLIIEISILYPENVFELWEHGIAIRNYLNGQWILCLYFPFDEDIKSFFRAFVLKECRMYHHH